MIKGVGGLDKHLPVISSYMLKKIYGKARNVSKAVHSCPTLLLNSKNKTGTLVLNPRIENGQPVVKKFTEILSSLTPVG